MNRLIRVRTELDRENSCRASIDPPFGTACSLIAVHEGYNAAPTAEGVALATTRTVVASSVLTLLLDYVLTATFL